MIIGPLPPRRVRFLTPVGQRAFERPGSTIKRASRIGNSTASIIEFPWMVSITKDGENYCSATLISTKHILTAGHCFDRFHPDQFTVVLGADNIASHDLYTIERFIEQVFVHPGYEKCCHYFDAAIALLDIEVPFVKSNPAIIPICLPSQPSRNQNNRAGQLVTLAGYGETYTDIHNQILRFATLKIYSQRWCNHQYQQFSELPRQFTSDILCAGYIVSFNFDHIQNS